MNNIFKLVILMLFFACNSLNAQIRVMGKIVDFETLEPISGGIVNIKDANKTSITDERGLFILNAASLTDELSVIALGHKDFTIQVDELVNGNKIIALEKQRILLNEITLNNSSTDQYQAISKLDIKNRAINNSQEVLRLVPGLFIGQHAGGGKAEQLFFRGFDIDHGTDVNITVDGMPVNMVSHAHGQGYADLHFLIPEIIDHVSFKKGAYAAEKGNFATSGAVSFKTFDVITDNVVKLEAGMFDSYRAVGMFNLLNKQAKQKGKSAYIASEYLFSNGYFDNPQNFNRINIFSKYNQLINNKHNLELSASTFSSKWDASGQIPDRAVENGAIGFYGAIDPNEGGNTSRTNLNAVLTNSISDHSYFKNQFYYTRYNFELYSNFTFFLNDPVNGDQIKQKEKRNLYGYHGSYNHAGFLGRKALQTEFGYSIRIDQTKNTELSSTVNRDATINQKMLGDIFEENLGLYVNETLTLNPKFTINTGLRYDYFINKYTDDLNANGSNKANAGILSPKINFTYQLNSKLKLFLSGGKGFHSNDTRVVVPQNGTGILPASYGADLGSTLKPSKNLLLNFSFWYLWLNQEFIYVGDESIIELGGETQRYGLDFSLRYQPKDWLNLDFDINYAHARALGLPKNENYLPLAPKITCTGGINTRFSSPLNASFRYRYMGDRPADETYSITAKGYFITDAQVNYTKNKFDIGLGVQNLFDTKWKETQFETESRLKDELDPVSEIHFTPGTPLSIKLILTYSF